MAVDGKLQVPDFPTIPFIEGDGIGPDIWKASVRVFDTAIQKAYGGKRKINWLQVLAGEEAGSKLDKAKELGIKIIDEEEFKRMVNENDGV